MAVNPDDDSFFISITAGYTLDSKGRLQSPKTPANNGGHSTLSQIKWPTFKEFVDPQGAFIAMWYKIFVISCLIAVSTDPLFLYIPFIDKTKNCVSSDKSVITAALILRSLTDMTFITHIIHQIRVSSNTVISEISKQGMPGWLWKKAELIGFAKAIAQKMSWLSISIVIDFLAILPIPQVAILVFFLKMDGSEYMYKRKILNVFLLFQYLPKIYRIYLSCKELKKTGIWARGAFNLFLYILASHVLGAFWYFLSIQRETSCWHNTCEQHPYTKGCISTYYCDDRDTYQEYMTLLNASCPAVNPSNATELFKFGIFLNALESGSTRSRKFPTKFFYSFWWGLRNLSSLGQNLETSDYVWENCFAILISLIGLLLFLYLIGNVQTYMQLATTKSEEIRQKMTMKELEIQWWMARNHLPSDMKTVIIENVREKLEENKHVDVENLLSIIPRKDRRSIKRLLCMDVLKKVPMLRCMDESVLKLICDNLKPVIYSQNSYVIRAGEPLDLMLFNTEGIIWIYTTSRDGAIKLGSSITRCLGKGDFYGEQLLNWASLNMSYSDLPISTQNVKCHTKVEAFSLMAKDLKAVVSKFWWHFSRALPDLNNSQLEELALSSLIARRRNRPKKHAEAPKLATDKGGENSQKLGYHYQRLYPVNSK